MGFQGPSHPVALKGRAWIDAESYQIVRLETDMIAPLPEIRLVSDRTAIEYGPCISANGMWTCGFRAVRKFIPIGGGGAFTGATVSAITCSLRWTKSSASPRRSLLKRRPENPTTRHEAASIDGAHHGDEFFRLDSREYSAKVTL